jgi:uncharacterized protein (TIGR00730 family)
VPREPRTDDEETLHAEDPEVVTAKDDQRRVADVAHELAEGYRRLAGVGPAVTIFGSARTLSDDPDYANARRLARTLGEHGYATITGGGPGIMAAANEGAQAADAKSIGIGIELEFEQGLNDHVDLGITCHYFFTRKVLFVRYASAFVCFPGGFGTLDELFEVLTLRQTRKIDPFPVVLVGTDYWGGLVEWLDRTVREDGKIKREDVERIVVTDDLDEVVRQVRAGRPRPARV